MKQSNNNDTKIGIVILIVSMVALGIVLYININQSLNFLSDASYGQGMGNLCSNEDECREYCFVLGNRGRCDGYCQSNPNPLCEKLYGEIR